MLSLFRMHKNTIPVVKTWWFWAFLALVCLGLGPWLPWSLDLTEDQKYTLHPSSIKALQALPQDIEIQVYLHGDALPAGFKRMEKELQALLKDMQAKAGKEITIQYIDPSTKKDERLLFRLDSLGIKATNVINQEGGRQVQVLIMPGLVMQSQGKTLGIPLLKGNRLSSPQEIINQSIEGMEYELMAGIQTLMQGQRKKLGFLLDYSQTPAIQQMDLIRALKKKYDLYPVDLGQSPSLDGLDAVCLLQPSKEFNARDLLKIDQFLLKGGKALFLVDGHRVDTLQNQGLLFTPNHQALRGFLYQHGLRLNTSLIKDAQLCAAIPLRVGQMGEQSNIQLMPWPAFPLLQGNAQHVITRNLDAVYAKFSSDIDTVPSPNLKKTPLLSSSPYTQKSQSPATLPFAASIKEFEAKNFQAGSKQIAYLVEGRFQSAFKNQFFENDSLQSSVLREAKQAGALILVADADIALNEVDRKAMQALPLGYDVFSKHQFANKDFLMNAFSYLLDEQQALLSRQKSIVLRPLDKGKIKAEKGFWQGLNLGLPLALLLVLGFVAQQLRKSRYTQA